MFLKKLHVSTHFAQILLYEVIPHILSEHTIPNWETTRKIFFSKIFVLEFFWPNYWRRSVGGFDLNLSGVLAWNTIFMKSVWNSSGHQASHAVYWRRKAERTIIITRHTAIAKTFFQRTWSKKWSPQAIVACGGKSRPSKKWVFREVSSHLEKQFRGAICTCSDCSLCADYV